MSGWREDGIESLGLTPDGVATALQIKEHYKRNEPLCVPGEDNRILVPENLINHDIDLCNFEGPLALAMMATRDPEAPMALAAATRMSPLGGKAALVRGVFDVVGEATRHALVRKCVKLVTDHAFSPAAIADARRRASRIIARTRAEYTGALRENLRRLIDGSMAPRQFVHEFFELTEAGNMRNDIRRKLVLSLLLSETIRPSIKFLMLENFRRMPAPVRLGIISGVLKAEPTHHIEIIKEELKWIVTQEKVPGIH